MPRGGANVFAGQGDRGRTSEAGGGGVAQYRFAVLRVVVARQELADWGAGGDEEIEALEEGRHLGAEPDQDAGEGRQFGGGDGCPQARRSAIVGSKSDSGRGGSLSLTGLDAAGDLRDCLKREGGVDGRERRTMKLRSCCFHVRTSRGLRVRSRL